MTTNRRQFSRILFQTDAKLLTANGEISVNVVDISLKGALIRPDSADYVQIGTNCTLKLHLAEGDACIAMEATVVHHQGNHLGLACRKIDVDSMTHLRRLVELNLGDESILQRELNALATQDLLEP